MLTRGSARCACAALRTARPGIRRPRAAAAASVRARAASSQATLAGSAAGSAAGAAATAGLLAPLVEELDGLAPCVRIHGSQVRVLETPEAFFAELKTMIRSARRRIFLSTLYVGPGETELVAALQTALRAHPGLRLHVLTDALRGTREAPAGASSASLLAPLVAEFGGDRVDVRMYHTPNLTGLRRRLVPRRLNEGWGLQHMKLYGADDAVLLSGANLSRDYFATRQDRYHVFAAPALADACWRLQAAVAGLSFRVEPVEPGAGGGTGSPHDNFRLVWPASNAAPSPLDDPAAFVAGATAALQDVVRPKQADKVQPRSPQADTAVYLLAQMTQLLRPDVSTERPAVARVLTALSAPALAGATWTFTAGYFNPAPWLTAQLLATAARRGNVVVAAAPQANGFYGAPGVAGWLPDAYTFLARRFLQQVHARGRADAVALCEWRRGTAGQPGGWTYHAKGLWATVPPPAGPGAGPGTTLTIVGSSNYTQRSYSLDLEAGALVVTANAALQARLAAEQQWLQAHAVPVAPADYDRPDRRVRLHVRLAMWLVRVVGGAL